MNKSSWNYCIVRTENTGEYIYNVYTVYYRVSGGSGRGCHHNNRVIEGWSVEPTQFADWPDIGWLCFDALAVARATKKPMLEFNQAGKLVEIPGSAYTRRKRFARWVKAEWVVEESGKVSAKGIWWWFLRAVRSKVVRWF